MEITNDNVFFLKIEMIQNIKAFVIIQYRIQKNDT